MPSQASGGQSSGKSGSVKLPPDFPLSQHRILGQLYKTIRGHRYYFGKIENWRAGLAKYEHDRPYLERGETPPPLVRGTDTSKTTMDRLANLFLAYQKNRFDRGELSAESYRECRMAMQELLDHFGRNRTALDVSPDEWARFREYLRSFKPRGKKRRQSRAIVSWDRRINTVRQASRWASNPDVGVLPRPLRFADQFERVPKRDKRSAQRAKRRELGPRCFKPSEIQTVFQYLARESQQPNKRRYCIVLRAMFLLGLNAGYSNIDVASLRLSMIDWKRRIIEYERGKTGIFRLVPLWKVTVAALEEALKVRPEPREGVGGNEYLFLTRTRQPWVRQQSQIQPDGSILLNRRDAIAEEFAKVLKAVKLKRPGLNFGAVRHTFFMAAGLAKDPEARSVIMGHATSGMDQYYEQNARELRQRVRVVSKCVFRRLRIKRALDNPEAVHHPAPDRTQTGEPPEHT